MPKRSASLLIDPQIYFRLHIVTKCDSHVNIPQGDRGKPGPQGPPGEPGHKVIQILLFFYRVFRSFVQPPKWGFYQIANNPFKDRLHCLRCVLTNRMKETSCALCGMFSLCKVEKCMQQRFILITAFKNGNIFAYITLLTSFLKDLRLNLTYFCLPQWKWLYFLSWCWLIFPITGFGWACWTKRATGRTCEWRNPTHR